jgi:hypothetical protein
MRPKMLTDLDRNSNDIHPNGTMPDSTEKEIETRSKGDIIQCRKTTNITKISTETIKLEVVQILLEGRTLEISYEE